MTERHWCQHFIFSSWNKTFIMKVSENCCLNIRVRISDKRTLIFVLMKYGKSAENEVDGTGIQLSVSSQFWNPQFSDSIIQLRNRRGKLTTGYTWFLVSLCKCVNDYDEITRFYNKNQPLKFTRLSAKKKLSSDFIFVSFSLTFGPLC